MQTEVQKKNRGVIIKNGPGEEGDTKTTRKQEVAIFADQHENWFARNQAMRRVRSWDIRRPGGTWGAEVNGVSGPGSTHVRRDHR